MVAGLAVCAVAARRHKLTDEQVPFFLSAHIPALMKNPGTQVPDYYLLLRLVRENTLLLLLELLFR